MKTGPALLLAIAPWLSLPTAASETLRGPYEVTPEFCRVLTEDLTAALHSYIGQRQRRAMLAEQNPAADRTLERRIGAIDEELRPIRERVDRLLAIEARVSCPRR
jgi:hypothetical protein